MKNNYHELVADTEKFRKELKDINVEIDPESAKQKNSKIDAALDKVLAILAEVQQKIETKERDQEKR